MQTSYFIYIFGPKSLVKPLFPEKQNTVTFQQKEITFSYDFFYRNVKYLGQMISQQFISKSAGCFFVIDPSDVDCFETLKNDMNMMLTNANKELPCIIFAVKGNYDSSNISKVFCRRSPRLNNKIVFIDPNNQEEIEKLINDFQYKLLQMNEPQENKSNLQVIDQDNYSKILFNFICDFAISMNLTIHNYSDMIKNDFIPKLVMRLLNIASIENVQIDSDRNIENIEAVIEYLKKQKSIFSVLTFNFRDQYYLEFSLKLFFKHFLNSYFLCNSREQMIERFNILAYEHLSINQPDELYKSHIFSNLLLLLIKCRTYQGIARDSFDALDVLFKLANVKMIITKECLTLAKQSENYADLFFYQLQLIYNTIDSARPAVHFVEKIKICYNSIRKIQLPAFSELAEIIKSQIKYKSMKIIQEDKIQNEEAIEFKPKLFQDRVSNQKEDISQMQEPDNQNNNNEEKRIFWNNFELPYRYEDGIIKPLDEEPFPSFDSLLEYKEVKTYNNLLYHKKDTSDSRNDQDDLEDSKNDNSNPINYEDYLEEYKKDTSDSKSDQDDSVDYKNDNYETKSSEDDLEDHKNDNYETKNSKDDLEDHKNDNYETKSSEDDLEDHKNDNCKTKNPEDDLVDHKKDTKNSNVDRILFKIYHLNESNNQWEFNESEANKMFDQPDMDDIQICFILNSPYDYIFNWFSAMYKRDLKPILENETEIVTYAACKVLHFPDAYPKYQAPIFMFIYVPKEKENIHSLELSILRMQYFLVTWSSLQIVLLNESTYYKQLQSTGYIVSLTHPNNLAVEMDYKVFINRVRQKNKNNDIIDWPLYNQLHLAIVSSYTNSCYSSFDKLKVKKMVPILYQLFQLCHIAFVNYSDPTTVYDLFQLLLSNGEIKDVDYCLYGFKCIVSANKRVTGLFLHSQLGQSQSRLNYVASSRKSCHNMSYFENLRDDSSDSSYDFPSSDNEEESEFTSDDNTNENQSKILLEKDQNESNSRNDQSESNSRKNDNEKNSENNDNVQNELEVNKHSETDAQDLFLNMFRQRFQILKLHNTRHATISTLINDLENEVNGIIPSEHEDNLLITFKQVLKIIQKEAIPVDMLTKELEESSIQQITYLKSFIHKRKYWSKEKINFFIHSHMLFLEKEFMNIIRISIDEAIAHIIYDDYMPILDQQKINDREKLKVVFEPYYEAIRIKENPSEIDITESEKKGVSYMMKESESIKELQIIVNDGQPLKTIIDQDF